MITSGIQVRAIDNAVHEDNGIPAAGTACQRHADSVGFPS